MKTKALISIIGLTLAIGFSTVFAQDHKQMNMAPGPAAPAQKAICVLYATLGNSVSGTVTFTKVPEGVRIFAELSGLTPGKHGFHIHEFGDCSSPDGTSAGGHFNPSGSPHGAPMDMSRHAGDMGNIEADASGKAHLDYIDPHMSFDGPNSILGRSVIVHAKDDDMKTQPTGNAGPRIACGVIGLAKAQ
ncbi:MAG: superoxide dismutase family protein [Bacteroidetes bacterium]|nr:superoxide dismutase family protein [Bacteroidota bacterium]